jgi:peptidyl-prolyl cis-trans isomerase D
MESKFEENNKSLAIEYFDMENLYKIKEDYTSDEINTFIEENKDQLKREYIDFKYVVLNPKNLIGIDEFNQDFFNEIDEIENKISQSESFNSIIENINVDVIDISEFVPNENTSTNEELIYSKKSSKLDIFESGDNYILYSIENEYDRSPDLNDEIVKGEIVELIYQKGKFDYNRKIIEEIQSDEFNENKFTELSSDKIQSGSIKSINDDKLFETNSIKMLYSLPQNSFSLVSNTNNQIFLVKIKDVIKNTINKQGEEYKGFVNSQNTNNRKSILQSYDTLLNNKYQVQLNQKTIDRIKNYFK